MGDESGVTATRITERVDRRAFLVGGAGLALPFLATTQAFAAPSGVPASGQVGFKVYRKGSPIGEHRLKFDQDGDSLTVTTDVHILVKLGPVPVYHFTQHVVERWRGDRFMSLDSTASTQTSHDKVTVRRTADGIHVEPSGDDPYTVPEIYPLTHWNPRVYQSGVLFNPKDGKAQKVALAARTDDTVKLNDGSSIHATRYAVTGDSVMDEYYDAQGVWSGMHSRVQDGSYVDYRRL